MLLNNEANYSGSVWGRRDLMKSASENKFLRRGRVSIAWHISKQIPGRDEDHKLERNFVSSIRGASFHGCVGEAVRMMPGGPRTVADSAAVPGDDGCRSLTAPQ